jgi:lysophospholipase L1-like esterase
MSPAKAVGLRRTFLWLAALAAGLLQAAVLAAAIPGNGPAAPRTVEAIAATAATGGEPMIRLASGEIVPLPGPRMGALRPEAVALVEGGAAEGRPEALAGAVWLEGDSRRSLAVRVAAWTATGWGETRLISPPSTGSQTALSAARLADGSWLVAWSAFDGHDDEIAWSRGRAGGEWSAPRRLTADQVPNITPAVAAAGSGAVIAWSRMGAGGYRLLTARFDDGAWSAPAVVAPAGSLYPSFAAAGQGEPLLLLYRTAQPAGWAALELDAAGRPLRQAEIADLQAPAGPGGGGPGRGGALDRPALSSGVSGAAGPVGRAGTGDPATATFSWPERGEVRTAAWHVWQAPAPAGAAAGTASGSRAAGGAPPATGSGPEAKAGSPLLFVAFGDSITAGFGDGADLGGYPGRLQTLLTAALTTPVQVQNNGLFGETTAEGLTRLPGVLQRAPGATGLLLMEGTNDINAKVSMDTTIQNLDAMAHDAESLAIKVYHATVPPRQTSAATDGDNHITGALAGGVRQLAWQTSRGLVDPFEVFFVLNPDSLTDDYFDKLHPNAAGYDLMAQTFADVLTGVDDVPPVTGMVSPADGAVDIPADTDIEVDLYDFGKGIDVANTSLLINGQAVATTPAGDSTKLAFRYQPPSPLAGVINVGLDTQDLASPPNVFNGTVAQFQIVGTFFLPGDLNHDGVVDGLDLIIFAYSFGAHRFNTNYSQAADLNGDGVVDGRDLAILAANFGKRSF